MSADDMTTGESSSWDDDTRRRSAPVAATVSADERWLVALDVDGTIMQEGGTISEAVAGEITRLASQGHAVMIATGRSVSMTLPVMDRLGLVSEYVVCANGAITLGRDESAPTGYSQFHVEEFDPTDVLTTIREGLHEAAYAVEDRDGVMRYCGSFPQVEHTGGAEKVEFEQLFDIAATRVVVVSPSHDTDDFLEVVERMGLQKVNYNVGWTAWLDIAPDGVTKATALERVRADLGIPRERVLAVGDGRNDIAMLQWAAAEGRGVSMGQAPDDVHEVANERTRTDLDDGLAEALAQL
ncbi:HAD family hydrolase [Frigoribacterium sp. PhB116]|uniref:HAD family hydrolase n=1 Tax=Frigoribacterium sp. PhB116 TaxID=2485174 RepID=UPI001FB8C083|nr:HAD family hydrolase [Frigoribacterium sp. PhB116]